MRFLIVGMLFFGVLAAPLTGYAQQARVYRLGVVLPGGPYLAALDGLREGLKDLGMEEGKHVIFHLRDVNGNLSAVAAAARSLEREKVDLIYSVTTSVTVVVKDATRTVPIVFYAGNDPVTHGLAGSFAKPGGRLTGIHSQNTLLIVKRLELLKELIPGLRRVLYVYNSGNVTIPGALKIAREASRQLKFELVDLGIGSVEELRAALDTLKPGEVDALSYTDGMVISQEAQILKVAASKKFAVIVNERASVAKGALASYGVSYFINGRLSAKAVQRVLQGTDPGGLPIEQVDRFHLALNLKTAKALGLKIPPSVRARADEIIE